MVGGVRANPRDFYRYINSQKKDRQGIPPLKKSDGSGAEESDPERAEELIGQFNDAFNKTEYKEVPLTERLAPFMDNIVVSSERVIKVDTFILDLKKKAFDTPPHELLQSKLFCYGIGVKTEMDRFLSLLQKTTSCC